MFPFGPALQHLVDFLIILKQIGAYALAISKIGAYSKSLGCFTCRITNNDHILEKNKTRNFTKIFC